MTPIRPEMKARYPKNWPEIRAQILERAQDRCEDCKVPNYAHVVRIKKGWYEDWMPCLEDDIGAVQIVLTIAHIKDPSPENCDPGNLKALCQRCHNRLDAPMRAAGIKSRAAEEAGQGELF